jgi:hypothetical protein
MTTDYDTWKTEGDVQTCPECGRRERMHYPGLCGACEERADEARDEARADRMEKSDVMGLDFARARSEIVSREACGLRVTVRPTGAGFEAVATWGECTEDGPDSRGSLRVERLELWRALEDLEAMLIAVADAVGGLRDE